METQFVLIDPMLLSFQHNEGDCFQQIEINYASNIEFKDVFNIENQ